VVTRESWWRGSLCLRAVEEELLLVKMVSRSRKSDPLSSLLFRAAAAAAAVVSINRIGGERGYSQLSRQS
jgi:hypothetical protein